MKAKTKILMAQYRQKETGGVMIAIVEWLMSKLRRKPKVKGFEAWDDHDWDEFWAGYHGE